MFFFYFFFLFFFIDLLDACKWFEKEETLVQRSGKLHCARSSLLELIVYEYVPLRGGVKK